MVEPLGEEQGVPHVRQGTIDLSQPNLETRQHSETTHRRIEDVNRSVKRIWAGAIVIERLLKVFAAFDRTSQVSKRGPMGMQGLDPCDRILGSLPAFHHLLRNFSRFEKIAKNGEVLDPCAGWTWNRHGHYDSHIPEVFPYVTFSTQSVEEGRSSHERTIES